MSNLASSTIHELAPLIQSKEVSPVEVTKDVINNIKKFDSQINAYISTQFDQAIENAELTEAEIMQGNYKGPIHGIPLALKDIFDFAGENVTLGSKIHKDYVSKQDATVVKKLKDAGAIFTGKLNMHEYAWGATTTNPHHGACKNPWDLSKIPGGSSGGSAAVVSSHMAIASLGTDTGGSIRIPSSMCGVVGLKPTHGRVSKYGCFPLAWSLDHIGPITKNITDAAILLEVIAGNDNKDVTTTNVQVDSYASKLNIDASKLTIGIEEAYFFNNVDSSVKTAVQNTINKLEQLGAKIELVQIPSLSKSEYSEFVTITTEAAAIHHQNLLNRPEDFGDDVRFLLEFGHSISSIDYLHAQQIRHQLNIEFEQAFNKVDIIISPTLPFIPPAIGENTVLINNEKKNFLSEVIRFTGPLNLTGLPALNIPCSINNGLPIGLQIIGPTYKESRVLAVGKLIENLALITEQPSILHIESV